jgi:hypothetical protein
VISPKNPYDKASRYALHLDPVGVLSWLLGCVLVFRGWLNARTLTFPGQPDRTCDSVAHLVDDADEAWAVPVEFQLRPDPKMFGRFLGYLGALWLELGIVAESGAEHFNVAAVVVNLTGVGTASRDLRWRRAKLRTCLRAGEANLATRRAAAVLRGVQGGQVTRAVLLWIPLRTGGDEPIIMRRWKALAAVESDPRKRSDYGALALIFAEAAGRKAAWKQALEGWNVIESQQVLEWQHEARVAEASQKLLRLLELKFTTVPPELAEKIRASTELATLNDWFDAAVPSRSLKQVRQHIGA